MKKQIASDLPPGSDIVDRIGPLEVAPADEVAFVSLRVERLLLFGSLFGHQRRIIDALEAAHELYQDRQVVAMGWYPDPAASPTVLQYFKARGIGVIVDPEAEAIVRSLGLVVHNRDEFARKCLGEIVTAEA